MIYFTVSTVFCDIWEIYLISVTGVYPMPIEAVLVILALLIGQVA